MSSALDVQLGVCTPHHDVPLRRATMDVADNRSTKPHIFPKLRRQENASLHDPQNPTNPAFTRWNPEGDHRALAPLRGVEGVVDPVSNFYSAGGDVHRGTGHTTIASMVDESVTPQTRAASDTHSVRAACESAPPETRRVSDRQPGTPYPWNSRKVIDVSIRAALGGWTSDADPREKRAQTSNSGAMGALKDQLVLQHLYKSSAQSSYAEVPWDEMLRPRRWPPTSTLEPRPEMVAQTRASKRNGPHPACDEAQKLGLLWDSVQTRQGFYKQNTPIPATVFCSPWQRSSHTPLYSGCIGARNLDDIDNANAPFTPFTVKRAITPRPTDTAHRPHIPKYAGCTLNRVPLTDSSLVNPADGWARGHASLDMPRHASLDTRDARRTGRAGFSRESLMSKMVTTVPPYNPFNKLRKIETVTVN